MKVLHLQKVAGIGGSERHLLALLPALRAHGIEPTMGVLSEGKYEPFVDALRTMGVPCFTTPAGPRINPLLFRSLVRRIDELSPDLVHTHLMHADFYGQLAARVKGVTGVSTVHSGHRFYAQFPYRSVARLAGHLSSATISISDHVAHYLSRLGIASPATIHVIHYGIKTQDWEDSETRRDQARASLTIAPQDVVVGIAARLVPFKGHETLLDAFALATEKHPRLLLLIAGDGPTRDELAQRAQRLGCSDRVRFLGFLSNVKDFMSACDLISVPSIPGDGEGFGLSAAEAMACGRAVVASDTDSLPEVVVDGETGLLVPPGDPIALAEAIGRLTADADLRARLGRSGAARAARSFSLAAMVERTAALYREVLEAGR